MRFILFILIHGMIFLPLSSEIEKVTIKWTPLLCTNQCVELLKKEFKKVAAIEDVSISQANGQGEIKWKAGVPFSFSAINIPMRLVGLSIRDIQIRVKGLIKHDAQSVSIISLGDYTRFDLLNPVISDQLKQTPVFNLAARQLTPEMRQKLIDGEGQNMIATVEGQMFMPGRSSAMQIVVGQLSFAQPKEAEKDIKK